MGHPENIIVNTEAQKLYWFPRVISADIISFRVSETFFLRCLADLKRVVLSYITDLIGKMSHKDRTHKLCIYQRTQNSNLWNTIFVCKNLIKHFEFREFDNIPDIRRYFIDLKVVK